MIISEYLKNCENIYLRGSKYFEHINGSNDRYMDAIKWMYVRARGARVIYIAEKNIIPIVRYLCEK